MSLLVVKLKCTSKKSNLICVGICCYIPHWMNLFQVLFLKSWSWNKGIFYFCENLKQECLLAFWNKIQTHKRFNRTLFIRIRTKHNMQIFGVILFFQATKQQLNGEQWDVELRHLLICFWLSCVVFLSNAWKNSHVMFCPNKQRSFEPFTCLDLLWKSCESVDECLFIGL